ncbi:MAG TPA: TolC family protein, partial [Gammaproteobacteria bacterium]|nr:TolC family protein [Gammaproteobacteria bacterium]
MKPAVLFPIILFVFSLPASFASVDLSKPLSLQQCLTIATQQGADIALAKANIEEYRARLSEVQANYYPKLSTLGYVAPMFTVKGDASTNDVKRDFSLGAWGPSTHLEALLAMPIYTFGRLEAGERAAKARLEVEKSRLREAENHLTVEVNKFYYSHLYAATILTHLQKAQTRLAEIQAEAQKFYDESSGKVSKVDLMKLRFAETEVKKYILLAEEGKQLALAALKHTMGLKNDAPLTLSQHKIPKPPRKLSLPEETEMLAMAKQNRPEWEQIKFGLKAASQLRKSESLAHLPVLFVASTFEADWSPTRDDAKNPYHYDPYNQVFGGVAVGFKLELDWALRKAKMQAANAKLQQVSALKKLAVTGIPLQINKARSEVLRFNKQINLSRAAIKASNKWVIFSAA